MTSTSFWWNGTLQWFKTGIHRCVVSRRAHASWSLLSPWNMLYAFCYSRQDVSRWSWCMADIFSGDHLYELWSIIQSRCPLVLMDPGFIYFVGAVMTGIFVVDIGANHGMGFLRYVPEVCDCASSASIQTLAKCDGCICIFPWSISPNVWLCAFCQISDVSPERWTNCVNSHVRACAIFHDSCWYDSTTLFGGSFLACFADSCIARKRNGVFPCISLKCWLRVSMHLGSSVKLTVQTSSLSRYYLAVTSGVFMFLFILLIHHDIPGVCEFGRCLPQFTSWLLHACAHTDHRFPVAFVHVLKMLLHFWRFFSWFDQVLLLTVSVSS